MAIWAFNFPGNQYVDFINKSLKQGISRFGWGFIDSADLRTLSEKHWSDMTEDEMIIFKKASFLRNIKKGDWIVHINIPKIGRVTAGQVVEDYNFEEQNNEISDFRHFFKLDLNSIVEFNRNNPNVHPLISRSLKLRGRYWRISAENEFFESLENIKNNVVSIEGNSSIGLYYFKNALEPILKSVSTSIHNTHPEKKLEPFLATIFRNIPNVVEVKVNGSGWGTDFGADLIVKYNTGIELLDLIKEEILVVQIKSYEGNHIKLDAVSQIKTAIQKFEANYGIIISTAESTENLEIEIEKVEKDINVPIRLIAGVDVAKFVLKYGTDQLYDI